MYRYSHKIYNAKRKKCKQAIYIRIFYPSFSLSLFFSGSFVVRTRFTLFSFEFDYNSNRQREKTKKKKNMDKNTYIDEHNENERLRERET